jgi:hypothetical protein
MTNSQKLRLNSTHGLKLIVMILVLACCGYAHSPVKSAPPPTRDWTKYPAVVEIDKPPGDIFAVSDPHAHDKRLRNVLIKAGLLGTSMALGGEEKVDWLGGKAVLVVIGDLIDKNSTGALKVINLLRALQTDAARKGGQVIVTMGNHEAEFLAGEGCKDGNMKCMTDFVRELKAAGMEPEDVANCKDDLGQWLCQLPIAARVGEWFFCHGGYTANRSIPEINSDIAQGFKDNGFKTKQLVGKQSILEAGLDPETGPNNLPWVFNGKAGTNPEDTLKRFTKKLGVRHIVQGHKPGSVDFGKKLKRNRGEMFQAYGLLFLIDADMGTGEDNSNDDSNGAALRIQITWTGMANDTTPKPYCFTVTTQAIAIKKDGSQKTLWEETELKMEKSGEPCK